MADIVPGVAGDEASADKCRDACRRKLQVRRLVATAGDTQSSQSIGGSSSQGEKQRDEPEEGGADKRFRTGGSDAPLPPADGQSSDSSSLSPPSSGGAPDFPARPVEAPAAVVPPAFGCVSLSGRTRDMEDAVSLQPCFFLSGAVGASPLHFFAVFDGHGGSHVSELCKERMHAVLAEELHGAAAENAGGEVTVDTIKAALARSFKRVDELALTSCICGNVGGTCGCENQGMAAEIEGSTAVVAVVDRDRVIVANCGDSRAVLARGGRAFALSSDQKPDRPDELARIEAAGGRVIYVNGARVLGILAMSRALGDKYLKPVVISDPEISVTERTPEDEFLIIASDGLWDVLSNRLACEVARRCIRERTRAARAGALGAVAVQGVVGAYPPWSHCAVAATLLARLALARKSMDNISVILVDLKERR